MSVSLPSPTDGGPPPSEPPQVIVATGHRRRPAWAIPAASVLALAIFGAGWLGGSSYERDVKAEAAALAAPVGPTATAAALAEDAEIGIPAEPTPTITAGPTLEASAIKLTPKVVEKQCFGSAGCNVTVRIEMTYDGPDLSSDGTFEVTYDLTGDEDGSIIGTFEVTGSQYTQDEQTLSTKSSKTKLTVKVTRVDRTG